MKNYFVILILLGTLPASAIKSKVLPLLPVDEVTSALPSLDQAIQAIYVSGDFDVPENLRGRLVSNADLAAIEAQAIMDLIADKSVPKKEKEIRLIRYELGDERMTKALIAAYEAGITLTVTTDLDTAFTGKFNDPEEHFNIDMKHATPHGGNNPGPMAKAVAALQAAGFKFWKDLYSQPLYNAKKVPRIPIMHEKALLLRAGEKKTTYFGTANLAPNPRLNRMYQVNDALFYDHYLEHLEALNQTFAAGKEIDDVPDQNRKLIKYADGTSMELAFTDGRFNPNERIAERLSLRPFNEIYFSHFVLTHRGVVEALGKSLVANPNATGLAVFDDRFADADGYGLAIVEAGLDVISPFGRPVHGYGERQAHQIHTYVYQRPALDPVTGQLRVEDSEEGAPLGRHLWHDKTTVINDEKTAEIYTGSLNLSNNFHNSELQVKMTLPPTSWLATGTAASIRGVVAKEEMVWAIPILIGTVRNLIGKITHHTDLEVPIELVKNFSQALVDRDYGTSYSELKKMVNIRSNLKTRLEPEWIDNQVNLTLTFLDWLFKNIPNEKAGPAARIKPFEAVAIVLGSASMADYKKVAVMHSALWTPGVTEEIQMERTKKAFAVLGMNEIDPKYFSLTPDANPKDNSISETPPDPSGKKARTPRPTGAQKTCEAIFSALAP